MKKLIFIVLTMMFWATAQADVVCIYKEHKFIEVNDKDAGFYAHLGEVTRTLAIRLPIEVGIHQGVFDISKSRRYQVTIEVNEDGGIVNKFKDQTYNFVSGWKTGPEGSSGPLLISGKPGYDRLISYRGTSTSRGKTRQGEYWDDISNPFGVLCYIDELYREGDLAHLPDYQNFDNTQYAK